MFWRVGACICVCSCLCGPRAGHVRVMCGSCACAPACCIHSHPLPLPLPLPLSHPNPALPPPSRYRPQISPRPPLLLQPSAAAAPGIASGIIWSAANISSILAVQSLGLAVAYPIMQAGLFVAGLWGVLLYAELTFLVPQLVYWLSGAVLVGGAALLMETGRP